MKIKYFIIPLLALSSLHLEAANDSVLFGNEEKINLAVNNRILAKVNGKAISLIDVMKKMDVLFYKEFPQYASSIPARYQFYKVNWKHVLEELVSKELVLADAAENKLPVSNGDVRQEMESLFGPNIIGNLDKIGMTYDEAFKIVQGDIIIRRMIYVKVNNKALKKVTPFAVKAAYEKYASNPENTKPAVWKYNVISVRNSDANLAKETAQFVYDKLNDKTPLEKLVSLVKENPSYEKSQVSVSEDFSLAEKDISEAYKQVLLKMEPKTISEPTLQKSRSLKADSLYRIFVLNDVKKGGIPSYNDMEAQIKNSLLDTEVAKETDNYIKKLKKHYHVDENYVTQIDATYEPFSLK